MEGLLQRRSQASRGGRAGYAGRDFYRSVNWKNTGPFTEDVTFFQTIRDAISQEKIHDPYQEHGWTYAAISKRATSVSTAPLKVYRKDPSKPGMLGDHLPDHPLQELFDRVNPHLNPCQLWEGTETNLSIDGEVFWKLMGKGPNGRRAKGEIPTEIFIIPNPGSMKELVENFQIVGWTFQDKKGKKVHFSPDEILIFKMWNPRRPFRGLSPLIPAKRSITTDHLASLWNEAFFLNGADPGGVVIADGEVDDDEMDILRSTFNDEYHGVRNRSKTIFMQGDMKYIPNQVSHRDMEYKGQKEWTREELTGIYGTPAEVLGYGKNTFENVAGMREMFWEDEIIPRLSQYADNLNSNMIKDIDATVIVAFDVSEIPALIKAKTRAKSVKVKMAESLKKSGWPLNDINKNLELGLENVEWGDDSFVPLSHTTASTIVSGGVPEPEEPEEDESDHEEEPPPEEEEDPQEDREAEGGIEALFISPERKANIASHRDEVLDPHEDKYKGIFLRHNLLMRNEMVKNFHAVIAKKLSPDQSNIPSDRPGGRDVEGSTKADPDDIPSEDDFKFLTDAEIEEIIGNKKLQDKRIQDRTEPEYKSSMADESVFVATTDDLIPFDRPDPDLLRAFDDTIGRNMLPQLVGVNDTIRNQVRATLRKEIPGGTTISQSADVLLKDMKNVFQLSRTRAETIARTEIGKATSVARFETMKKAVIEIVEWTTLEDGFVRGNDPKDQANHVALHGTRTKLGDEFDNGLTFPREPSGSAADVVNCRCELFSVEPN